jgi:uncharacterized membrane-anchored protein YhcB (DUF1043 family)
MSEESALQLWLEFIPATLTALAGLCISIATLYRVVRAARLGIETHALVNAEFQKQKQELTDLREQLAALRAATAEEHNRKRPSV